MAAEMKVTDAVVDVALLASFHIVCENEGIAFSEEEFQGARRKQDAESREMASKMMRAALEAGLAAMLEPQRQTSYAAHAWLDITEHEYQSIGDEPCTLRTLYRLRGQ